MTGWNSALPPLHLVASPPVLLAPHFAVLARRLLATGGPRLALHLRGRDLPGRALFHLAEGLAEAASRSGAWLVINDRVDVALASGCAGVQLGEAAMPAPAARRIAPELVIGASVHDPAGATAAAKAADFLLAGTLFPTASHPGRAGSGTGWLSALAPLRRPVVGIGGVTPERVREVVAAGGAGVAVMRGVWEAADPVAAAVRYLNTLEVALGDR